MSHVKQVMKLNTEHALLVQVTVSYCSIYTYELLREVFSLLNFSQKPMLKQLFNFRENNELLKCREKLIKKVTDRVWTMWH